MSSATGKLLELDDDVNQKAAPPPSFLNSFAFKMIILVLLSLQNTFHALLTRYSKGILKETYSGTEVVLVNEVIKLVVSGFIAVSDTAESDAVGKGWKKLYWLILNSKRVIVLVVLYCIPNLVTYYALARLEISLYSVLLQLKILTTAFFAVAILGRNISFAKWRALFLLVLGCVLVASPAFNAAYTGDKKMKQVSFTQYISGIIAVLIAVITTGYSSIYFEGLLKQAEEKLTIWERNFQLATYSCVLLFCYSLFENGNDYSLFFKGWSVIPVMIAVNGAFGGLLVAATLKYADSILKTLATSASIVLSTYLGYYFLGGPLDIFVSIGAISCILAIFNYTFDGI